MPLILREDLDRRLTINELDGNFTYLQTLSQTNSGGPSVVSLTYENDNNTTISSTASVVLISSDMDLTMDLTLPTPIQGWQMTLIRVDYFFSENALNINGTFFDGSSYYSMNYSGSNIVIIYDGSAWHIISTNTSD